MGITIRWNDQTAQQLDTIEIYRSDKPIDENNPGTPIAVLGPTVRSYEDNDVKVGNVYFYSVAVVKGGNRSFGASQSQGYLSNLGPGGQKVIRGDWVRGYFGELASVDFATPADVANKMKDAFKSTVGMSYAVNTSAIWYKFVYKGKILFIPNIVLVASSNWVNGYNAGFIFGTDDFGDTPMGSPGAVNQRCIIEVGGQQYIARSVRFSDLPFNQYLVNASDFNGGEWKSTMARLVTNAEGLTNPAVQPRFSDLSSVPNTASPHRASSTTVTAVNQGSAETLTTTSANSTLSWMVVLELLP